MTLRRFPYPYRAALAISNDADLMDEQSFRALHGFLNTTQDTPFGPGLGLEVGDSFFLFNSTNSPNRFSYFAEMSNQPSSLASLIRECAHAGVLDTLHSYGDFSSAGEFTRSLAERGLAILQECRIKVPVWVNHGTAANVQNIGSATFHGDEPGHPAYHADLAVRYGFEYFWLGDEHAEWIGHDPDWRWRTWLQWKEAQVRAWRRREWPRLHLINPIVLRDRQTVLSFQRYFGTDGSTPTVDDLPHQLSGSRLGDLEARGGYAIIYQHLGVRRRAPGFGPSSYHGNPPPYLRDTERAALQRLATAFHSGRILVTTTARLLRLNALARWLSWRASWVGSEIEIVLSDLRRPDGTRRSLQLGDLMGLTFYTDGRSPVCVYIEDNGARRPVGDLVANPPDHTGQPSVAVAWKPIACPSL